MVSKLLLARDKLMPQMHFRQSGYTYSASGPFDKNKEKIRKFKETWDLQYIYQNELDKACFHRDLTYGDFKDLPKRTSSDKILHHKGL